MSRAFRVYAIIAIFLCSFFVIKFAFADSYEDIIAALGQHDYARALEIAKPLAESGDRSAQFNLGVMYSQGLGQTPDYAQAIKWFKEAADYPLFSLPEYPPRPDPHNASILANYNLGVLYYRGLGGEKDDIAAMEYFKKAADKGNSDAQLALGKLYEEDRLEYASKVLVPKNSDIKQEAKKLYRKSADQGNLAALSALGYLEERLGNNTEALALYQEAAMGGDPEGQYRMGVQIQKRISDSRDKEYIEVAKWYRKAADQGLAEAQSGLGFLYYEGRGVDQDYKEAYFWFTLSPDKESYRSQRESSYITPDEKAEVETRVKAWKPVKAKN